MSHPTLIQWLSLSTVVLAAACTDAPADLDDVVQHTECRDDGTYIDENGEEHICIVTDEPGDPGWDPWPTDPCFYYPEFCYPPEPEDPCEVNPSSCDGGGDPGGDPPLACSNESDIPADFDQQVNNRVQECFDRNWSRQGFVERQSDQYQPGSGGWTYAIADWLVDNTIACAIQNIDWMFFGNSAGGQTIQSLTQRLAQMAFRQRLTSHQKICAAMCVSGKLIGYSRENFTSVLPSGAVETGLGQCRDFAQIGERLLDGLGFSSSVAGNIAAGHAFVEVTSPDGGSFYVEPQQFADGCIFYNRH